VRVGGRATALRPVDGLASACAAALTPTARLALLITGARRGTATIRGPASALAGATAARTALTLRSAALPLLVGLAFGVLTRQAALGALRDAEVGEEVRRGGVGLCRFVEVGSDAPVAQAPAWHVVPGDERHRNGRVAGATGGSDAVDVGPLVLQAPVGAHAGHGVDVDAAGRDTGGHEHVDLAPAEGFQRVSAL